MIASAREWLLVMAAVAARHPASAARWDTVASNFMSTAREWHVADVLGANPGITERQATEMTGEMTMAAAAWLAVRRAAPAARRAAA